MHTVYAIRQGSKGSVVADTHHVDGSLSLQSFDMHHAFDLLDRLHDVV